MQDPYDYEIHVNPGYGKKRFSSEEIRDIFVAIVVLSIAFLILYRNQTIMACLEYHLGETGRWAGLFAICFFLVVFSFLLHEFGHKFTAQKYGMWSEFRLYPVGLILTLVTSMMGIEKNGKISMAGPIVNIILAAIGIAAVMTMNNSPYWLDDPAFLAILVFMMLASLNSFLAVFNLIPLGPLDGGKILTWNKVVWIGMFAIAVIEVICAYYMTSDISYYPMANPFI